MRTCIPAVNGAAAGHHEGRLAKTWLSLPWEGTRTRGSAKQEKQIFTAQKEALDECWRHHLVRSLSGQLFFSWKLSSEQTLTAKNKEPSASMSIIPTMMSHFKVYVTLYLWCQQASAFCMFL